MKKNLPASLLSSIVHCRFQQRNRNFFWNVFYKQSDCQSSTAQSQALTCSFSRTIEMFWEYHLPSTGIHTEIPSWPFKNSNIFISVSEAGYQQIWRCYCYINLGFFHSKSRTSSLEPLESSPACRLSYVVGWRTKTTLRVKY